VPNSVTVACLPGESGLCVAPEHSPCTPLNACSCAAAGAWATGDKGEKGDTGNQGDQGVPGKSQACDPANVYMNVNRNLLDASSSPPYNSPPCNFYGSASAPTKCAVVQVRHGQPTVYGGGDVSLHSQMTRSIAPSTTLHDLCGLGGCQ
jgi:hypothetical protein